MTNLTKKDQEVTTMARRLAFAAYGFGIALSALLTPLPTFANGVNLLCKEKIGTDRTERTSYGSLTGVRKQPGEEKPVSELWSIPVFIDTGRGTATLWGDSAGLSIEPDTLTLRRSKNRKTEVSTSESNSALFVNRKNLSFRYSSLYISKTSVPGMASVQSFTTRTSEGTCTKIVSKGNKI